MTVDLFTLEALQQARIGALDRERSAKLMGALDACNTMRGRGVVFPAAAGIARQRSARITKIRYMLSPLHDTDRRTADVGAGVRGREHLKTPDGRYFIVAGRIWRSTNPALPEAERHRLVAELMDARRAVKEAKRGNGELRAARASVDSAKVALGERGPVWWDDGAPDWNRHMAKNTPYAEWAGRLRKCESES